MGMKGISTIIATLLMLVITIGLAGMAYVYISGIFTRQTQGIEIVDSWCSGSTVTMIVRNLGTTSIPAGSITCIQTAPSGDNTCSGTSPALEAGQTGQLNDTCTGTGSRNCVYRLIPPGGRSIEIAVNCIG